MTDRRRRRQTRDSSAVVQSSRRNNYRRSLESHGTFNTDTRPPRNRRHNNRRFSTTPSNRATDLQQYTRPSNRVIRSVYEGIRASVASMEDTLVTLNTNLERLAPDPSDMAYSPITHNVFYVPVPRPPSAAAKSQFNSTATAPAASHTANFRIEASGPILPQPPHGHTWFVHHENHQPEHTETSATMTSKPVQPVPSARNEQFLNHVFTHGPSGKRVDVQPLPHEKMSINHISPQVQNHNQGQNIQGFLSTQGYPQQYNQWLNPNSNHHNGEHVNVPQQQPLQRSKSNGDIRQQTFQFEDFTLDQQIKQGEYTM